MKLLIAIILMSCPVLATEPLLIGVIDSGAELSHPLLSSKLLVIDRSEQVLLANDTLEDYDDHGTHISGIIVQTLGQANYRIVPIKNYSANYQNHKIFSPKSYIRAIDFALEHHLKVLNISEDFLDDSPDVRAAFKKAEINHLIIVTSAGNDSLNLDLFADESDKHMYPCQYGFSNIICVGSYHSFHKKKLPFSNYGSSVLVGTEGVNIRSSCILKTYCSMSGSSMSAALVTAHIAKLLLQGVSPDKVKDLFLESLPRDKKLVDFFDSGRYLPKNFKPILIKPQLGT